MFGFEFEAVVWQGATYCVECLPPFVNLWNEEEVSPIFADSEYSSYPECNECGKLHDYVYLLED